MYITIIKCLKLLSFSVLNCRVLSFLGLSFLVLSFLVLSFLVLSFLVIGELGTRYEKKLKKSLTMPKQTERRTLWDFSSFILSQNSKKLKGILWG